MLNIVTIKWGQRYGANLVNELFRSCQNFCTQQFTFHCFTDDASGLDVAIERHPLPEIDLPEQYRWTFWRKLSLFGDGLPVQGACLYLDIDVVIVGNIDSLFERYNGKPRFIKNWVGKKTMKHARFDKVNSSVVLFEANRYKVDVLDTFYAAQQRILSEYPGDQGFLYDCLETDAEFFTPGICVSFKKHCLPKFPLNLVLKAKPPAGAAIVLFHGKPEGPAR